MNQMKSKQNQIVRSIYTSFISWGWPVLLSFTITPLILKYLGDDGYGIRAVILTVSGYFALFDLGLNGAGTKYLAEFNAKNDNKSIEELLSTTRIVYLIMGFFGLFIIFISSPWLCKSVFNIPDVLVNESVTAFRLSGVGFLLGMITWWLSSIPTGLQRYDIFNGISIFYGTINVLGNLIAVYWGFGIIGIVISNIISNLLAIFVYLFLNKRLLPEINISFKFSVSMFKKTMSFGLYMIGFSLFAIIFSQLDKTIIGVMLTTTMLTYYVIPLSISNINQQVNGKLLQVMFPLSSELMANNEIDKLQNLFYRSLNMSAIVGLAISIPLLSYSKNILEIWISQDMANTSSGVLFVLVISFLLAGLVPYTIVAGMGHAKVFTTSSMISGISGIVFFLLLIKPFGIMGMAIGKLLSIILTVIYYLYISKSLLKIELNKCFKIVIIPFITAFILILLGLLIDNVITNLYFLILFSVIISSVFLILMWFTNQIKEEDKKLILSFLNKRKNN